MNRLLQRLRQPLIGRRALVATWLGTTLALSLYLRRPLGGQLSLLELGLLTALLTALAIGASSAAQQRLARAHASALTLRARLSWLGTALFISGLGVVALAPVALELTPTARGRIASAGPRMNLLLALLSLALLPLCDQLHWRLAWLICYLNYEINTLYSLFNLLPLQRISGAHILEWDQVRFAAFAALACLMFVVQYLPIGKTLIFHFGWA